MRVAPCARRRPSGRRRGRGWGQAPPDRRPERPQGSVNDPPSRIEVRVGNWCCAYTCRRRRLASWSRPKSDRRWMRCPRRERRTCHGARRTSAQRGSAPAIPLAGPSRPSRPTTPRLGGSAVRRATTGVGRGCRAAVGGASCVSAACSAPPGRRSGSPKLRDSQPRWCRSCDPKPRVLAPNSVSVRPKGRIAMAAIPRPHHRDDGS
jgi:hypothetical protein